MNRRFFVISGLCALTLSAITYLWVSYGLPGLVAISGDVTELCHSFFVRCMEYSGILSIILPWAAALTVAGGFIYALIKAARRMINARRAAKTLNRITTTNNVKTQPGPVVAIKDDLPAAFTFGLLRPRIYISTGLVKKLDRQELLGVFHHELHHKKNLDPLKLFIMNFIADALFYIPAISALSRSMAIKYELSADAKAAEKINDPLALASAIVKVGISGRPGIPAVGISGDPAAMRVRRLTGDKIAENRRIGLTTCLTSILAAAFIIVFLIVPVASSHARQACSTDHCSTQKKMNDNACKRHCKTHGAINHSTGGSHAHGPY